MQWQESRNIERQLSDEEVVDKSVEEPHYVCVSVLMGKPFENKQATREKGMNWMRTVYAFSVSSDAWQTSQTVATMRQWLMTSPPHCSAIINKQKGLQHPCVLILLLRVLHHMQTQVLCLPLCLDCLGYLLFDGFCRTWTFDFRQLLGCLSLPRRLVSFFPQFEWHSASALRRSNMVFHLPLCL